MTRRAPPGAAALADTQRVSPAWLGLAVVLVAARAWTLHLAELGSPAHPRYLPWLPLAVYQDLLLVFVLAGLTRVCLQAVARPGLRRAIRCFAWLVCLACAAYAVVAAEVYRFLHMPLTYPLLAMSDHLRGVRSSLVAATTSLRLMAVVAGPLFVIVFVVAVRRRAWPERLACAWHGRRAIIATALYASAAHACVLFGLPDSSPVLNPHWSFCRSLFDRTNPFITGDFEPGDLADFLPPHRAASTVRPVDEQRSAAADAVARRAPASAGPRLNVLMVVMESVGARYVQLCGAPYANTPELMRLAQRGVVFDRLYASHPYTSSAMAGLFCSVYPYHGWRTMCGRAADFGVPGIADVLGQAGYRTAFLHTGDLSFDHERAFLESHGFAQVDDAGSLFGRESVAASELPFGPRGKVLPDRLLAPAAFEWIDADPARPFFLTLWTIETHHPYAIPAREQASDSQASGDVELDRYVRAIRASDALIGRLVDGLAERGLADATLVVVLGDHGDAFGQHGQRIHAQTLYEEEVRIPLVMSNPRLFPRAERVGGIGQQIDLAPTLAELVGQAAPAAWQGTSLFAAGRRERAYLFTAGRHYLFGMVEGDAKYVYDASANCSELYDLERDAAERRNRVADPEFAGWSAAAHRRLAAWLAYQNDYLAATMGAGARRGHAGDAPAARKFARALGARAGVPAGN